MSAEAPREVGLCYFREGFSVIKCRDFLILDLWGKQAQLVLPVVSFCFSISCRSDSSEQVGATP